MNTQDLLEQASLDALGLLDDQERSAFESAFRAAPPAVQSQIRREQARFAASESLLPAIETPAGLKFRVMAAVREAIHSFNRVETARRAEHTPFLRSLMWNSTPLWRAACIGFATATVTLGVFFSYVSDRLETIERTGTTISSIEGQMQLAPDYGDDVLAGRLLSRYFNTVVDAAAARAVIQVDPDSGAAYLWYDKLPVTGAEYQLIVAGDAPSKHRSLASFESAATQLSLRTTINPEADLDRLAIWGPAVEGGANTVIMSLF